ncbi:MAG TPA: hypothetical protein PLD84_01325 [Chitinophagales bacterium]|nr:hypothetical protein [Chitinophagales bacterium]
MMEAAKIILSADELEALKDRSFFKKKQRITEKIYRQFANVVNEANSLKIFSGIEFPAGTDLTGGKISKGENYLGLPYLLLDFPRNFKGDQLLAIRTMLWWGNFISSTLFVSGKEATAVQKSVVLHLPELSKMKCLVCVHESPWHHHFEKDNYQPLNLFSKKELTQLLKSLNFIKIARKIPVSSISKLESFAMESFKLYGKVLSDAGAV